MSNKQFLRVSIIFVIAGLCNAEQPTGTASHVEFRPGGVIQWTELSLPQRTSFSDKNLTITNWDQSGLWDGYLVPIQTRFVYVHPSTARISATVGEILHIPTSTPPVRQHEMMLDGSGVPKPVLSNTQQFNQNEWYRTKVISRQGENELWAVTIFGARYSDGSLDWEVPTSIDLQIHTGLTHLQLPQPGQRQPFGKYLLNQQPAIPTNTVLTNDLAGLSTGKLKLSVSRDGIYRVHFEDFSDSIEILAPIPSASITLTNRGVAVPIFVEDHGDGIFGSGDYFEFIGKMNRRNLPNYYYDPYSDVNVYWLDWGGPEQGLRLAEESGYRNVEDVFRPVSFRTVLHLEQDITFERLGTIDTNQPSFDRDHFFWANLNSGSSEVIPFIVPDPNRSSANRINLRIGLTGLTYHSEDGVSGDHLVHAYVNDRNIGSGIWQDQTEYVISASESMNLTATLFSETTFLNELRLFAPGNVDPRGYDKTVINWLEIDYDRLFIAYQDQLFFKKSVDIPSSLVEFEVKNFSSPDISIIKNGTSIIRDFAIRPWVKNGVTTYSAIFQDQVSDATPEYYAGAGIGILVPEKFEPDTVANLRDENADYIVITNRKSKSALLPLVEHKQTQGYQPLVVAIQDIYDEFSHGIATPEAIRSFLRYGLQHWSMPPEYVLLVGDANINPKAAKNDLTGNFIPTMFIQTRGWGATEADYYFSLLLNDDYIPDLHVGRLPCTSLEEVTRVVNKIINYDLNQTPELWRNEILAIAGFENTFKYQSENLLNNFFPQDLNFKRLYIDRDSEGQMFFGNTDTLIHDWNAGKLWINFMGHGGGAVWADRSLFTREDVPKLSNTVALPFVTSMTCFTGGFASNSGLGEVALKLNDAGAIGWYGSSGVGWIINDYLLVQSLFKTALNNDYTMGEAVDITRMIYFSIPDDPDGLHPSMLFQYNYLGDPSLRLKKARTDSVFTLDHAIYNPTDNFTLEANAEIQGEWHYQIVGPSNVIYAEGSEPLDLAYGETLEIIPTDQRSVGLYRLIYTIVDNITNHTYRGVNLFSVSQNWFQVDEISDPLSPNSHFNFPVLYHGDSTPDSIKLTIWGDTSTSVNLIPGASQLWNLAPPLLINANWQYVYYRYTTYQNGSTIANSATYQLPLAEHQNVAVENLAWGHLGNRVGYVATILYTGHDTLGTVNFSLADSSRVMTHDISWGGVIYPGRHEYFVHAIRSPDTLITRFSVQTGITEIESDNSVESAIIPDVFQILPNTGVTFSGTTSDTLKASAYQVFVQASVDTAVLGFEFRAEGPGSTSSVAIESDSGFIHIKPTKVSITIAATGQLYGQQPGLPNWFQLHSRPGLDGFYDADRELTIGNGRALDHTAPIVDMMIGGQRFFEGNYISQNAELNLVCEDEAGFTWDTTEVEVSVDDIGQSIFLGDTSASGQIITARCIFDLEPGEHEIRYRVADALQNWTAPVTIHARVASRAEILDYGNYPNPFQSQTWFVYEITQDFDDLRIDIFTLAGWKIHTIDIYNALENIPINQIGYHELVWDGTDRYGDFVANGVYFYRIVGRMEKKSFEGPIGKIVKIR